MLEIIAQILCAMLLLKGIEFIAHAAAHGTEKAGHFMFSILAGVAAIIAGIYFYNQVSDQASGARDAMETATQNLQDARRSLQENIDKFERDTGVKVP